MMITNRIKSCFMLLVLVVFAVSCSESRQDYVCVIPNDATAVISVDLESMAEKSTLSHSSKLNDIRKYMRYMVSDEVKDGVDALIDDPSLSGIDFSQPAYIFMTPNRCVGLTMKVEDESMLEELVGVMEKQGFCSRIKKHDGLQWSTLMEDINIVFSGNTMLMMTQVDGTTAIGSRKMQSMMLSLMQMEGEDSFASSDTYEKMLLQENGDIRIYANLSVLPLDMVKEYKRLFPVAARLSDVRMVGCVAFENGEARMNTILYSNNAKIQKLIEGIYSSMKPIEGQYMNYLEKDIDMYLLAGIKGDKALEYLKKIPRVREYLVGVNLAIDCDNIIRSINGDIQLSMKDEHSYSLISHLENNDVMNDIDEWMKSSREYGIEFSRHGSGQYRIENDGSTYYITTNGNDLYVGSEPKELNLKDNSARLNEEQKGKYIYMNLNIKDKYPFVDRVEISSANVGETEFTVKMKNPSENILKQLLEQWKL